METVKRILPHLSGNLFLTDGGLETTLIFDKGIDLPEFASFVLLQQEDGPRILREYFESYLEIAQRHAVGFVLESATWRANPDRGDVLGYSRDELEQANHQAIEMLHELRTRYESDKTPVVISGNIGPRGDGYSPGDLMSDEEAERYHAIQLGWLADAGVDFISAFTITNTPEAIGIVRAAVKRRMPVVISFTVETDGSLPTGQPLKDAIEQVDAATGGAAAYFMINCAHPTHFEDALASDESWTDRIRGVRANASAKSHAELDESTELDDGNPAEFGAQYADLRKRLKNLNVFGGCCGTDIRHVEQICKACVLVALLRAFLVSGEGPGRPIERRGLAALDIVNYNHESRTNYLRLPGIR